MTEILTCHFRRVIASLFAIVVSVMMSGTAVAGDACKNIMFKVTNKHDSGETILIKKVKYFNKANGKWQTEVVNQNLTLTLPDAEKLQFFPQVGKEKGLACQYGATCKTQGDNLRDAEGEDLTKFRFIYKYMAAGKWSGEVEGGDKVPDDPKCYANRTYGPGESGWTIFGKD